MTANESQPRGYDDSAYLKEMADGLVIRRYASVDEAAKSVLDETGGSNVDRLRRKFREQNWYERGLKDYVASEMARQGTAASAEGADTMSEITTAGRRYGGKKALALGTGLLLDDQLTITGTVTFVLIGIAMLAVAVASDLVAIELLVLATVAVAVGAGLSWAAISSVRASWTQAMVSLTALAATTAGGLWVFGRAMPHDGFTFGSLPGEFIGAIGVGMIGVYTGSFLWNRPGSGRNKTIMNALCFAIGILGCSGLFLANYELRTVVREDDVRIAAWSRVSVAIAQFAKENPDANIDILRSAQKDLLGDIGQIVRK